MAMSNTGSTDVVQQQSVLKDVPFIIDENPFERMGYEFAGWSRNKNAATADVQQDGFSAAGISSDLDLYAIWRPVTLTFTFDPNGGKFQNGQTDTYIMSNIGFGTFPNIGAAYLNPTRDGYEFNGWYDLNGGAKISQWTFYAMDNMNFLAKWTQTGANQEPDIPQAPSNATQPDSTTNYNVIAPKADSGNKFSIVGSTNPCSRKTIVARFSGPSAGGLVHSTGTLSTTCNPFTLGFPTFTYQCTQFPGEYYYKVELLPGMDRESNQTLKVGPPNRPIWSQRGKKFLGWILKDQSGNNISGAPSYTYFCNKDTSTTKGVYINIRYVHDIYASGCQKTGFDFYAKTSS